ncbi:hypothetical protein MNBD_GAMMA19-2231 [hydrothermal vent metagenome]|uniref:Bacterial OB-fold domain-containing protein n=1 Tax=hydrothermal vent metagenome TaxID=652676 RepID=A0A3B1ATA4_9ZZZZ
MKKLLSTIALGLFISTSAFAAKMTVEEVNTQMAQLKGKEVTVTGKVVKVNNGIMKRNFVHVQDGTGGKNTNNLIITSKQTATVGDNITATGIVVLGTDFGMGYMYPLLVEQSVIKVNK